MTNAIVETEVISTAQLIQEGIAKGIDLVALKEILKLREIDDAFKARKDFAKSFSLAQSGIEVVVKKKTNNQTHSKYAELADIIMSAQPIYTKEGFSVICYEGDCPKEGNVRIFADVLHSAGHKETYHLDMPLDGVGFKGNANMTAIHGKKSATTYARNTLMCMIWNIPTSDNDGNTQTADCITPTQLAMLESLLKVKDLDKKLFLSFLEIESLEMLPATQYTKALTAINEYKKVSK
jgi:hypothetical protein